MQLLSRRKHHCVGKGPMELSACSHVSKDRTLGNYSDYSARSLRRNAKAWPHTERRTSERDARAKASTLVTTMALTAPIEASRLASERKYVSLESDYCTDPGNVKVDAVTFSVGNAIYVFLKSRRECLFSSYTKKNTLFRRDFLLRNFLLRFFLFRNETFFPKEFAKG